MTISKKLQKILAVTLMTSFLSTSFVMGVSEAAAARPNGGGRPPAQSQQIRRETQKGPSGHQMKTPMQRQRSDHQARPAVHKSAPTQRMQSMHKSGPNHKAQPMAHKNGSIRQGSSIHHGGPAMHKGGPGQKAVPSVTVVPSYSSITPHRLRVTTIMMTTAACTAETGSAHWSSAASSARLLPTTRTALTALIM